MTASSKPHEMSDLEAWNKHIDAGFPFRMHTSREEQQMKDCFLAGISHERSRAAVGLSESERAFRKRVMRIKAILNTELNERGCDCGSDSDEWSGDVVCYLHEALGELDRLTKEQTR